MLLVSGAEMLGSFTGASDMAAYQKFTDALRNGANTPSKSPKPPKISAGVESNVRPLGRLGALGGGSVEDRTLPPTTRASAPEKFVSVWSDADEERAALVEYGAGAPRAWAEALARLDAAKPPGDVSPGRWLQFIDDCGRFLDAGWGDRAVVLGWHPLNLFGCDRERPLARIDRAGLLWLLNGGKLAALTRETAVIETSTGARQTYYRRPLEPDRIVLAWELSSVV